MWMFKITISFLLQDAVRMKSQPAYQKYSETSIEMVSSALTCSVVGLSTSRCSGNEPALLPFSGRAERAIKIKPYVTEWKNFSFANVFIDGDFSELAMTVNLLSLDRI